MKQFGSIYLILGTCIAAGMLSLPIVTASGHFALTSIMVISAWALMTTGAWCLLQVNLWLPPGSNLMTMSKVTLGHWIMRLTGAIYLLLLYSLICAYLTASSDVLNALLRSSLHLSVPRAITTFLALIILGRFVYHGIHVVDVCNRFLMSIKIIICFILIVGLLPHVEFSKLSLGNNEWHGHTWLVIICAFGYAIILPSIRVYLDSDRRQLNRVVLIGSVIPMVLYLIWIIVVQGTIPRTGQNGLIAMNGVTNTNSLLMNQFIAVTHYLFIQSLSVIFLSICSITGFLGVSLCLMDFLADALHCLPCNKPSIAAFTFLPPCIIVLLKPEIFTHALAYAGLCCVYVLIILPIAMYCFGCHNLKKNEPSSS